jgi:hypothetical protein
VLVGFYVSQLATLLNRDRFFEDGSTGEKLFSLFFLSSSTVSIIRHVQKEEQNG